MRKVRHYRAESGFSFEKAPRPGMGLIHAAANIRTPRNRYRGCRMLRRSATPAARIARPGRGCVTPPTPGASVVKGACRVTIITSSGREFSNGPAVEDKRSYNK